MLLLESVRGMWRVMVIPRHQVNMDSSNIYSSYQEEYYRVFFLEIPCSVKSYRRLRKGESGGQSVFILVDFSDHSQCHCSLLLIRSSEFRDCLYGLLQFGRLRLKIVSRCGGLL